MANNPYVNKVIYGNQTVMDISGDTVTPADVTSGVTFHDASGAAQTGSRVVQTVNPSNDVPARLTEDVSVRPLRDGYAIESYTRLKPSNVDPPRIEPENIYHVPINAQRGWAIISLEDVQPSNTPTRLYSNGIYKIKESSGYLIESYASQAPDDTNPPSVSVGDMVKITSNGGYLYETQQSGGTLTPTIKYQEKSNPNNPRTYTYDATKRYMIVSACLVTTALTGVDRTSVWYLDKGTLGSRMGASQTDGQSTVTNNTSTHTLTMAGTNSSYRTEFTVIQLD